MRGFAERADIEEVDGFLREQTRPLEAEAVDLLACAGRVLAEDVTAEVPVPGFERSAMDGYAVRGEDTFGASSYDPIPFRVLGEALPGAAFDGVVEAKTAVRVMTGAPVPKGADAVVQAEVCEEADGVASISEVSRVGISAEEHRQFHMGHSLYKCFVPRFGTLRPRW